MENVNNASVESSVREIDLMEVLHIIWSKALIILLVAIISAAAVGVCTKLFIEPKYSSYVTMYVRNKEEISSDISSSDLSASSTFANNCIVLLEGNTVLNSAIDKLLEMYPECAEHEVTPKKLLEYMNISQIGTTPVLKVEMITEDPEFCVKLATAFEAIAADEIVRITESGSVKTVDMPVFSDVPVSPNIVRNAIIGFLLGGVIAAAVFIFIGLQDKTIYTEKDIEKVTSTAVIGVIPKIIVDEKRTKDFWIINKGGVINAEE